MRIPYLTILFLLFLSSFFYCNEEQSSSNQPFNIVLFYADDLGWKDLSIQGSKYYETPNIDRIAQMGMRFTNAYANAPNCAPSRASLMTGLYPPKHGIYTVASAARGKSENRKLIPVKNKTFLDTSFLSLAQYLQEKGYATCTAGKWHISNNPLYHGFDSNFGGLHWGAPKSYFSPYKNPYLLNGPKGEHLPDRLSTEVVNWISGQKETPFFVYFPFYSVHTPIQAREDLTEKYIQKTSQPFQKKPKYAAMIEAMDLAVGKVLEQLEREDLLDNTIIIFTSDNGAHGAQSLSRPLRGAKGMLYEGGIRVPFLIHWPGITQPNSISKSPIIGLDIFPSFQEMLEDEKNQLDGQSFLPLLNGKQALDRTLYWHFPAYLEGYKRDQAYEDAHKIPWRTTPVSVIRKGDWKLLEFFEDGALELYNLGLDLGETQDLASENPEKTKELYEMLKSWQDETRAFIPSQLNPEYKSE